MSAIRQLHILVASVILVSCSARAAELEASCQKQAERVLQKAGIEGGLIVHIGCGDGKLTAALRASDNYLVHGLDTDAGNVRKARESVKSLGIYGSVSVDQFDGKLLPYIDNLVNLLVTEDLGSVPMGEVMRVLCPGGVAYIKRDGKWKKTIKAWPDEIDEWTHYLHDPSNNAVADDTIVGPPKGLQWTCGPEYARSHEHFGSVSAMVSSGGRVFYIIDEGPISSVFLAPKWRLVARDAFSGVLLWQEPISNWESQLRGFRSGPPEIGRRLIADGDCVHIALGYGGPVSVLDGATGEVRHVLSGTEGARELLCQDGVLYVLADDMTATDHDERKKWIHETAPTLTGYRFPQKPLAMYGRQRVIALQTETGKVLWTQEYTVAGEIMPATLAVADGRVCLQSVSQVACLDANSGDELWRSERSVARSRFSWSTPTLVIADGVVLTVDRIATAEADDTPPQSGSEWLMDSAHQSKKQDAELVAFSLNDGELLWRAPCFENYDTQLDIFAIDGVVWVGDLRHKRDAGFTEGRHLRTGKVAATIPNNQELYDLQMGHHRCYRNKATSRYLLLGRDGIEFVGVKDGTGSGNWWVRGTCQYGIMPANGLIYVPQHSCACHPAEKIIGFNTLSPRSSAAGAIQDAGRLSKGPAYASASASASGDSASDWPTYRRDAVRSGFQDLPAPGRVSAAWTENFVAPITAPVVASERVFFAEQDRHMLYALSAGDGKTVWAFAADGRIDSPPTISRGMCVFGTRNGFVYCLRAADGALVWRFRAAPRDRRLFSYEQLESVWPVHGSVLIDDQSPRKLPVVYFAAGRSSHLDGGIFLYGLDLKTGEVRHQADVTMAGGAGDGQDAIRQRVLPDVLSLQRGDVFMRDMRLGKNLALLEKKVPHLYAPGGFLDDTWWHRTYWIYGTTMMSGYGGWPKVGNVVPAGRLLAFDGTGPIYGYGRMSYRAGAGHVRPDARGDYQLFAESLPPETELRRNAAGNKKGKKPLRPQRILWSKNLPFLAKSIVLTRDALLVAGGQSLVDSAERHDGGKFWIVSREDGTKQSECELATPPVLDGMAFTTSSVFVSAIDGSVVCLREAK
ncbi:MAG: outer membrane protein assembly factor BamB family protein [Planctomycetota bacterium]|jgi:outer membrane protein assembly factor BamB